MVCVLFGMSVQNSRMLATLSASEYTINSVVWTSKKSTFRWSDYVWSCIWVYSGRFPEWCFPARMGFLGTESSRTWAAVRLLPCGVCIVNSCASRGTGTNPLDILPDPFYITFVHLKHSWNSPLLLRFLITSTSTLTFVIWWPSWTMSVKKSSDSQLVVYTLGSTVILLIGAFWTRMGHFEKWHKGGCETPRFVPYYVCSWETHNVWWTLVRNPRHAWWDFWPRHSRTSWYWEVRCQWVPER